MTYLEWRSILKCEQTQLVTSWEATRCKVKREKVKVESKKWKDNNRAADDRLSRKRKKKKNKERDFRWGSWDPGGGGGKGGDALRARAPRGQVPSALPPFPFSPSLPPEGGRAPHWNLVLSRSTRCYTTLHEPDTLALNVEEWTPLSLDSIDEFQDFEFPLFNRRLKFELRVDSDRLFHSKHIAPQTCHSQNNLSF